MSAEQSLREGKLDEALVQLQDQVRKNPAEPANRIFLFQLMSLMGQWERALNQLNVLGDMDASTLAMVQTYREALRCEMLRSEVFTGKKSPMIFGEPAQWVALMVEALRLSATGKNEEASSLRDQALADAPAISGTIDGQEFSWIADADERLGPLFEAVINGRYYWVPGAAIRRIELEEPEDLRDFIWMPAQITWANGGQTVALIPSRYAGSEHSEDNQVRMARKTDWLEQDGMTVGLGQRLLATEAEDYPLLDIRVIEFDSPQVSVSDLQLGDSDTDTENGGQSGALGNG